MLTVWQPIYAVLLMPQGNLAIQSVQGDKMNKYERHPNYQHDGASPEERNKALGILGGLVLIVFIILMIIAAI